MSAIAIPAELRRDDHVYCVDGVPVRDPSVTEIIESAGLSDYSMVPKEYRDRGMYRGTNVHWMAQLEAQGVLNYRRVPAWMRPYRKGLVTWLKVSGFIPLWCERSFYHPSYGFCGTLDLAGTFTNSQENISAIVDLKTGTQVMDWVRFQLAAYTTFPYPDLKRARHIRRIALLLTTEPPYYKVKEFPMPSWQIDFATFMEARSKRGVSG